MEKKETESILKKAGVFPVLLASALWGIGYFVRKTVLDDISVLTLAFVTAATVSAIMFLISYRRIHNVIEVTKANFKILFMLSMLGVVVGSTLMLASLHLLDVGIAVVLERLQPVFTIVLARWLLFEKMHPLQSLLIPVAIVSSILIASPLYNANHGQPVNIAGLLCVIGAALSWAFATILGKRSVATLGISPSDVVLVRFSLGAIVLAPLVIIEWCIQPPNQIGMTPLSIAILAAVVCTAGGYFLFYWGLKSVSAGLSSLIELVTPIVSILLGMVVLGERLTPMQWVGVAGLLTSVWIAIMVQNQTDQALEEID